MTLYREHNLCIKEQKKPLHIIPEVLHLHNIILWSKKDHISFLLCPAKITCVTSEEKI